jgi:DnaJ family protein C protein 8
LLIDEEVRRRKAIKMNLANEGLEARKKDEEVATRKRKAEDDKVWEGMDFLPEPLLLC